MSAINHYLEDIWPIFQKVLKLTPVPPMLQNQVASNSTNFYEFKAISKNCNMLKINVGLDTDAHRETNFD